ncbi:MAG: aquaporin [Planctomycetes bacterium]|nr:aquaporin [Planctomycetota bacterium]
MTNVSKLMAEAIGTFALCFVGAGAICIATLKGAGYEGLIGVAAAHGLILSIGVSAAMNICGGHPNPAVTFAMLIAKRINIVDAVQYIIAQCAGGVVAGFLIWFIFNGMVLANGESVLHACQLGTPNFNPETLNAPHAAVVEILMTFLLVFAVFGTAVDPRAPKIGGWGIGLTLAACIFLGGPLTGAALNPARCFGTGIVAAMTNNLELFWSQQWVYWVGPIAGGAIAAMIYQNLILDKKSA